MGEYRDTTCPQPGMACVYRFYDAGEELLYVGESNEPWRRRKQHSISQPWYPQVRHQVISWYDSEAKARAVEKLAIRCENPRFNIADVVRPKRFLPSPPEPAGPRYRLSLTTAANWAAAFCCAFAVSLVSLVCLPAFRSALVPLACVTAIAAIAAGLGPFLLVAAPRLRRFWAWVELSAALPAGWEIKEDASVTR